MCFRGGGLESQSRGSEEQFRNICRTRGANPTTGVSTSAKGHSLVHVGCRTRTQQRYKGTLEIRSVLGTQ